MQAFGHTPSAWIKQVVQAAWASDNLGHPSQPDALAWCRAATHLALCNCKLELRSRLQTPQTTCQAGQPATKNPSRPPVKLGEQPQESQADLPWPAQPGEQQHRPQASSCLSAGWPSRQPCGHWPQPGSLTAGHLWPAGSAGWRWHARLLRPELWLGPCPALPACCMRAWSVAWCWQRG